MLVNIEFLDQEAIENVITCLNYKVDKVIFFGRKEDIELKGAFTENFLKKHCGVLEVEFHPVSETNLVELLEEMTEVIEKEQQASNEVFFDLTGGEGLMLVAFGILSKEKHLAMHMYQIESGWLYELNSEEAPCISQVATKRQVPMNIDTYIQMQGGVVNHSMHKANKELTGEAFAKDIAGLWQICDKYKKTWNIFSEFLRDYCQPSANLEVAFDIAEIEAKIQNKNKYKNGDIERIFVECSDLGVLENMVSDGNGCKFRYKSAAIQDILWDAGSVLEMHTYMEYREKSADCMVGVHLDWDGTIHGGWGRDTINEIDVLALKGYIPTFISCKNGNVDQMALYELETVAKRFGGKYAKKVLVAPQGLNKPHRIRAREMGIEVK